MSDQDQQLPCRHCGYDLRGTEADRCPECGKPFTRAELRQETPGLVLEDWLNTYSSCTRRALTALRIAFSPRRAFKRDCRLEKTLYSSPGSTLRWWLLGYLLLVFAHAAWLGWRGQPSLFEPQYSIALNVTTERIGSPYLLPLQIPVLVLQCLAVAMLAMVVAARPLKLGQLLRLIGFLLPLSLPAALLAIGYELLWGLTFLLDPVNLTVTGGFWSEHLRDLLDAGNRIAVAAPDLMLGLLAGFAVGTVLGRRRWLITLLSGAMLFLPTMELIHFQWYYVKAVCEPVYEVFGGDTPDTKPDLRLLRGPNFQPGPIDPSMAGRWEMCYLDETDQVAAVLDFNTNGQVAAFAWYDRTLENWASFDVDQRPGLLDPALLNRQLRHLRSITYKAQTGGRLVDQRLTVHLRLEITISVTATGGTAAIQPHLQRMTLAGQLNRSGERMEGIADSTYGSLPLGQFEKVRKDVILKRVDSSIDSPLVPGKPE